MWFFRAVAFDLDGTLTTNDSIAASVVTAIDLVREDRAVLLVTGRTSEHLEQDFPGLADHFDAVVTENGAVMRTASGEKLLAAPIDGDVDRALTSQGVPFGRGRVLLTINGGDATSAAAAVASVGLDHQIIHNRGAGMILPAGVTKGTGLVAALAELHLSPHNCIAVGDAENDLALLRAAEVGVAVRNAVPALADSADLILDEPDGAGAVALLTGPLITGHRRLCPERRSVRIGSYLDGSDVRVPGSQSSMLICGGTGNGKSYLAGLLAELWIDAGYSVLVVDPEGDHTGLAGRPGVHVLDVDQYGSEPTDVLAIMTPNHGSLVLDLSGMAAEARLAYLGRLPDAIRATRAQHGIPHWVIHDEAQDFWSVDALRADATVAQPGTCLVTWRPELLPPFVLSTADLVIVAEAADVLSRTPVHATLQRAGEPSRAFDVDQRVSRHVRHRHKYATKSLAPDRHFRFHRQPAQPARAAASVAEFVHILGHCDPATLDYHLARGDFSRWVIGSLHDPELGAEIASIERDLAGNHAAAVERARERTIEAIKSGYSGA